MIEDPRGIWVKVDGVTTPQDAVAAASAGVSAIGMIFAPSPRRLTIEDARLVRSVIPPDVLAFGVFADAHGVAEAVDALNLDGVQLPSGEPPVPSELVLRTVRVREPSDLLTEVDGVLHLDAYVEGKLGGTGALAPWDVIAAHRPRRPFVLSGGLTPANVAEAIERVAPHGVDVSSGVESSPGVKDHAKMRAFVATARGAARPRGTQDRGSAAR